MLKAYYKLAKPGIIYGNLITCIAGYLMASRLNIYRLSFIGVVVGTTLVVAAASVVNNIYDKDIDLLMERTKKRPSASGVIKPLPGLVYGAILAIIGFTSLIIWTNYLTTLIASLGFIIYVVFYSYFKRKTHYATIIGSFSGAAPIVGGYVAYSNHLTSTALTIGLMMLIWQLPHFYAIAIYREKDYRAAAIPVLSVVAGKKVTSYWLIFFSFIFLITSIALYWQSSVGLAYLIVMSLTGLAWLTINLYGLVTKSLDRWAKKSFFTSLAVVLIMSFMLSIR